MFRVSQHRLIIRGGLAFLAATAISCSPQPEKAGMAPPAAAPIASPKPAPVLLPIWTAPTLQNKTPNWPDTAEPAAVWEFLDLVLARCTPTSEQMRFFDLNLALIGDQVANARMTASAEQRLATRPSVENFQYAGWCTLITLRAKNIDSARSLVQLMGRQRPLVLPDDTFHDPTDLNQFEAAAAYLAYARLLLGDVYGAESELQSLPRHARFQLWCQMLTYLRQAHFNPELQNTPAATDPWKILDSKTRLAYSTFETGERDKILFAYSSYLAASGQADDLLKLTASLDAYSASIVAEAGLRSALNADDASRYADAFEKHLAEISPANTIAYHCIQAALNAAQGPASAEVRERLYQRARSKLSKKLAEYQILQLALIAAELGHADWRTITGDSPTQFPDVIRALSAGPLVAQASAAFADTAVDPAAADPTGELRKAICNGYARLGQIPEALAVARAAPDSGLRNECVQSAFSTAAIKLGPGFALSATQSCEKPELLSAYRGIADRFAGFLSAHRAPSFYITR